METETIQLSLDLDQPMRRKPHRAKQALSVHRDHSLTLTGDKIRQLEATIQTLYLRYKLPWIIGFSQGKDSTASAQIVWRSIEALPVEQRRYPLHIVMGDTRSETPNVHSRIALTKRLMEQVAGERQMPIAVHIAQPAISESILVRIIGYGYAAPTVRFRWCVERAKINPIGRVIQAIVPSGRAIQVLGSRRSESANRAATIDRYAIPGSPFSASTKQGVYIYTPIVDWTTQDVWMYLSNVPSPWGGLRYNLDLRAMYKQDAEGGECPLVLDKSAPACGSGRFGCWCCTVSETNRSLYSFVDDNEWAYPLVEIYEFLRMTTNPKNKAIYRDPKLKPDGSIKMLSRDPNTPTPGKYKFSVRKLLLEMVLKAQLQMRRDGPDPDLALLRVEDIRAIRYLWIQHPNHPQDGSDPAREIALTYGIDIGAYSRDDERLLHLPQQTQGAAAEQVAMHLFETA